MCGHSTSATKVEAGEGLVGHEWRRCWELRHKIKGRKSNERAMEHGVAIIKQLPLLTTRGAGQQAVSIVVQPTWSKIEDDKLHLPGKKLGDRKDMVMPALRASGMEITSLCPSDFQDCAVTTGHPYKDSGHWTAGWNHQITQLWLARLKCQGCGKAVLDYERWIHL